MTFAELDAEVSRTARRLASLGVQSGSRVATLVHNGIHAAILPHAALRLGATLVPLNVRLSRAELEWQLSDVAPGLFVVDGHSLDSGIVEGAPCRTVGVDDAASEALRSAPLDETAEMDVALRLSHDGEFVLAVIYTSGTTGRPKGAMLTVSNFWWSAIGSALNLGVRADDRWLACLPLFHVGGLSIILRSAIYGTTAVIHPGFDAVAVNAAIDNEEISILSVVPVMLSRMLDARSDKSYPQTLRCVLLGGGSVSSELLKRCAAHGVPVVQTYGLTEACSQVATLSQDDALGRLGSAGKVLYPNELKIAEAESGDGEIMVRGPIVMAGYAGNPEASREAMVDGWLRTGDIGRIDHDGYLYVLDRRDDLIITGGENVYPAEVEAVLLSHDSVDEAAVIGIGDEVWGQRVVAIVRLKTDQNESPLLQHCASLLASYKVPKEIRFVTSPLPRTASGKLQRAALREQHLIT